MAARLFLQHLVREAQSLDGAWGFQFPVEGTTIEPDAGAGQMVELEVPGVWEQHPHWRSYRGQAVATRRFEAPRTGVALLVFKGVSHTARVFVDGREVGGHHNAFTPFDCVVEELPAGEHELCVHVSNEHGALSSLHIPNDYYNYGGISRPVEVQFLQQHCWIDRVRATPRWDGAVWSLDCAVDLRNVGKSRCVEIQVRVDRSCVTHNVTLASGQTTASFALEVAGVVAWEPGEGRLYDLVAELHDDKGAFDDWHDRIGFREIFWDDRSLIVNRRAVFLRGVNRHEDHPLFGCALPLHQMRQDVAILQDLGCNAVRTSHYPNDERFLDLCDEAGILVWEENHARGQSVEQMREPQFREQCLAVTEEMVLAHHNHPSIVIWGVMNECASDTGLGRELYEEQLRRIRELDDSRPTVFASCQHGTDMCQDLPDVLGWNVYPLWYTDDRPAEVLESTRCYAAENGGAGKPLIISECGAGALPGYSDPIRRARWSVERQQDIVEDILTAYFENPALAGLFFWQFCDVRVDEAWAICRPRTMNNKGLVDEYRVPKPAYEAVKRVFRDR